MAAVDSFPKQPLHKRNDSFGEEKVSDEEKAESGSIEVASSLHGDVYDDFRAIDMGEDGKERPIGKIYITTSLSPS